MTALVKMKTNDIESATRATYSLSRQNFSSEETSQINEAFPDINPGILPHGNRVIIQLRALPKKTKGGIIITSDMRNAALYDEQVGKVVAIGASAFHSQTTMDPWPEGAWFDVGDFVRVPKFGGDKQWTYTDTEGTETAFVIFRDFDILGTITTNPLNLKGFVSNQPNA